MDSQPNGELVPQGGGDNIPLTRSPLIVGRRDACDICLPFSTLSGRHCELTFKEGHWIVVDLDSTNGTSVNDMPVQKKILHSGDTLAFGSRRFTIQYNETGRLSNLDEFDEELEEVMGMSLLEKAGLASKPRRVADPVLVVDAEENDDTLDLGPMASTEAPQVEVSESSKVEVSEGPRADPAPREVPPTEANEAPAPPREPS